MCSKLFPKELMHTMVQILGRKAYTVEICPVCLILANNNPSYYELCQTTKELRK
jgi:hypothetical protein